MNLIGLFVELGMPCIYNIRPISVIFSLSEFNFLLSLSLKQTPL